METRRLILVSALMIALLVGWQLFIAYVDKLHPGYKEYMKEQASHQPTTQAASSEPTSSPAPHPSELSFVPSSTQTASVTEPVVVPVPVAPATNTGPSMSSAPPSTLPANITLGSTQFDPGKKGPYALGVEINPRGAGLERVVVNQFRQKIDSNTPYEFQQPCPAESDYSAALATRSITVDGKMLNAASAFWHVDSVTPSSLTLSLPPISDHNETLLVVRKIFTLASRSEPSLGYELSVRYAIENLSGRPLDVKVAFNGANVPSMENSRDAAMILDATDSGNASAHVVNIGGHDHLTAGFKDNKPVDLLEKDKGQPFLWAGVRSSYFDAYVRFVSNDNQIVALDEATAMALTPTAADGDNKLAWAPPAHEVQSDAVIKNVVTGFQTAAVRIPARGVLDIPLSAYMGPAAREVLDSSYYKGYPRRYNETLVVASGWWCCSVMTMPWLVDLLVSILWCLHWAFRDWGLAIIGLVVLVRAILHPITKKSQVSMMKMGKMGPEMERLKKKFGDDKEGLNKAMAEYYKTQGITPFLGCLPMFLQMPIWIALWSALQSTFEIRHASFLWGLTWIKDLAGPDRLFKFEHPIPLYLFGWQLDSINVLPLLLAATSYFQQKVMQPQNVSSMTPEQQQQQKMMKWMSVLLFPLLFYTSPSGLMLYIITSNAIAIVEGQIIRKHIKEQEEKEQAGVVIVDEPAPAPSKRGGKRPVGEQPKPPAGGLTGWLQRIQKMADNAQKQQKKKRK